MTSDIYQLSTTGDLPIAAAAVHDGHAVRPEAAAALALTDAERLREEDPFTGGWAEITGNRIVALRSRFEVDLNRSRETAVYQRPEDAWGLQVWNEAPSADLVARSLGVYDAFYDAARELLRGMEERFGHFVVFDLHSYNHRREGPEGAPADPSANPEVNIGTKSIDRQRWGPVIDSLIDSLRGFDYAGRQLDVRENVKFGGGHFPRWVNGTLPESCCAIAIEFKKFFMDEWTGLPDREQLALIHQALEGSLPPLLTALQSI